MSKALSLKMDDRIFDETEGILRKMHVPRNAYINQAVAFFNRLQKRNLIRQKLRKDVHLLWKNTTDFIKETELLDDLPE